MPASTPTVSLNGNQYQVVAVVTLQYEVKSKPPPPPPKPNYDLYLRYAEGKAREFTRQSYPFFRRGTTCMLVWFILHQLFDVPLWHFGVARWCEVVMLWGTYYWLGECRQCRQWRPWRPRMDKFMWETATVLAILYNLLFFFVWTYHVADWLYTLHCCLQELPTLLVRLLVP